MRLSVLAITIGLASFATVQGSWLSPAQQFLSTSNTKVPGDSPIYYCQGEIKSNLIQLDYINLEPNPPFKGKNFTLSTSGKLAEDIKEGAYVMVQVRYGFFPIFDGRIDLCEESKTIDEPCPIAKGNRTVSKEFAMTGNIPSGKYVISGDAYTKDDQRITCITAEIHL